MLRVLTAGESHGPALTAIIEGLPAGMPVDVEKINHLLAQRQEGYGRGNRMKIETDQVEITSGIRHGKTLGSPVTLVVVNHDYSNWEGIMDSESVDENIANQRTVHQPRPGHADLVGGIKYRHKDLRNVLERSSARETTMRVAVGALAIQLLEGLGIKFANYVSEIGKFKSKVDPANYTIDQLQNLSDQSELKMIDHSMEDEIKAYIDEVRLSGNTLGGIVEIVIEGVPMGLGSYVQFDRKLDGRLSQAMMSINAFKGVEIGDGFESARRLGSEVMDEIAYSDETGFFRQSNHLGGFEGGMTNGMPIIIRGAKKPIPTLYQPLESVNVLTKEPYVASVERSDTTAVPAASLIAKTVIATEIASAVLEKFSADTYQELIKDIQRYREYTKNPDIWQGE